MKRLCYKFPMPEREPEDQFIRNLVILAATGVVAGLLAASTVVMVLVSANFNVLNWME
jgi:hypothetical protein